METFSGALIGFIVWFFVRYGLAGLYTVGPNERAVKTRFGRADRIKNSTTMDDPISEVLEGDEKPRYAYPLVRVIKPGGPYWRWPWEKVHKVSIAVQTLNMAQDLEVPTANNNGTELEAVTKDQLNVRLTGQIRFRVSERNLYAYLFGVKNPIVHVMGYFVSLLRERIANYEAPRSAAEGIEQAVAANAGISINDLRKNLSDINAHMVAECKASEDRYGIILEDALITGIDPPQEVDSALAAINTAHNHVSSEISVAQASADQKIVQSRRAVEIETLRAQAEVEPLRALAVQLRDLKKNGPNALALYVKNLRLGLLRKARRVILEAHHG